MPTIITKMIAGAIAAVLIWVIYFGISGAISYIKTRKTKSSAEILEDSNQKKEYISCETEKSTAVKGYFTKQNIRGLLFVLIGCLSLYYSTQCVFYDQFDAFRSSFFGEGKVVANELSSQISAVGFQARGDGKTLIQLMHGLFIIIGLICLAYGGTDINVKK